MTIPHPGTDINCRCYDHHTDPLFIKLTTDYPGDWIPHKQGYRVKWGKVTAHVYRTGSDEEICVEMTVNREVFERKANSISYLETDGFDSCLDAIEYCLQLWRDDGIAQLFMFKDCPEKIKDFFDLTVKKELEDSQDTITQLKEQLKAEQRTLRQLNKLKGVLGL